MLFTETALKGAFIIDLEQRQDSRGFFARTFCAKEWTAYKLKPTIAQCNVAFNYKKGTVRGMHYQAPPFGEVKLVRCTMGAIYDVIIDMRPHSSTYLQHIGVELTAQNRTALYVPEMFAHGYQTLTDSTEVAYQMSEFYAPEHQYGLRYDDPAFSIKWPIPVSEISEKDTSWPLFESVSEAVHLFAHDNSEVNK